MATSTTDATCTEAGSTVYTATITVGEGDDAATYTCDETKTEEIAATGHSYESVVTDLTCADDGEVACADELAANMETISTVYFLGGDAAVTDAARKAVRTPSAWTTRRPWPSSPRREGPRAERPMGRKPCEAPRFPDGRRGAFLSVLTGSCWLM